MKRALCLCGEEKMRGHPKWCFECWLERQPISIREEWATWRREQVPPHLRRNRVPKSEWPEGRRWCSGCQSFVRLRDCSTGASRCKTCNSISNYAGHVERVYGITADDYKKLFIAQDGRCYICQRRTVKRLAVDHDHETGEVRGLLCPDSERGCNHAILGNIRDLAMAKRIVEYLESPPARKVLTSR